MKIREISPKFIDMAKRGVCTLVAAILIAIPHTGTTETKVETSVRSQTKFVQEYKSDIVVSDRSLDEVKLEIEHALSFVDLEERPTFILTTHWVKSSNYEVGKGYAKDNREYVRRVYTFTINEKFNPEYFEGDLEKIALFFRDNENASEIFEMIDVKTETIMVSEEKEKSINTKEDVLEVEGTNISLRFLSREEQKSIEEKEKREQTREIILGSAAFLFVILIMIIRYKKYGIMGLK